RIYAVTASLACSDGCTTGGGNVGLRLSARRDGFVLVLDLIRIVLPFAECRLHRVGLRFVASILSFLYRVEIRVDACYRSESGRVGLEAHFRDDAVSREIDFQGLRLEHPVLERNDYVVPQLRHRILGSD